MLLALGCEIIFVTTLIDLYSGCTTVSATFMSIDIVIVIIIMMRTMLMISSICSSVVNMIDSHLEVKREYYQNSSVLDCVTQCSQSAAHFYEQFLQVQQIRLVTLGPLRCA